MSLRDTQAVFFDAISKADGNASQESAVALIKSTGQLSPQQRLAIYRNTGLASRIKAIQQIYPVCESILGMRVFRKLAHDYVSKYPSYSNDLNSYGERFSVFMGHAVQTHSGLDQFNYLQDLCTLEWLWHKVYYQDDDSTFDFEVFAVHSQSPDQIVLTLSHSLEIMETNYPIHLIWQQHRDQQLQSAVEGLSKTDYLCIYRQGFVPKIVKISQPYFALLSACRQGKTLAEIALDKQLSMALQDLPKMITKGWVCGFTHHDQAMEQHV